MNGLVESVAGRGPACLHQDKTQLISIAAITRSHTCAQ